MKQDLSALLPDGRPFDFWEKETAWTREIHVDANNPSASDENDGASRIAERLKERENDVTSGQNRKRMGPGH